MKRFYAKLQAWIPANFHGLEFPQSPESVLKLYRIAEKSRGAKQLVARISDKVFRFEIIPPEK
jgi:hypothetical protein